MIAFQLELKKTILDRMVHLLSRVRISVRTEKDHLGLDGPSVESCFS